jgi:hypothetical protein
VIKAYALAVVGFVVMAGALVFGFSAGDFWGEGGRLASMPWGIVSLVDVYTGFALFSGWVVFREPSRAVAAWLVLLVMVLGNAFACGYVLWALARSRGDWVVFWMGPRASSSVNQSRPA